jgi:hypothetical protein
MLKYLTILILFCILSNNVYCKSVAITFFNKELTFEVSESYEEIDIKKREQATYGFRYMYNYFDTSKDYQDLRFQLEDAKSKLTLDGWGYFCLIKQLTNDVFVGQSYEFKQVLIWYLLTKNGYHVAIMYDSDYLGLYSKFNIPVTTSITIGSYSKSFYHCLDCKFVSQPLHNTYYNLAPSKKNRLDIRLDRIPDFIINSLDTVKREIRFVYKDENCHFDVTLNKTLISYLDSLPNIGFSKYRFGLTKSINQLEDLIDKINLITEDFSPKEKVNFLLKFTQEGFGNESDEIQFGYERYFFPEELIYFGKGDCDDKTNMLAYLIHETLGEKTYAVVYGSHVNVGIASKKYGELSTYEKYGVKYSYVICEPTWQDNEIGAMKSWIKGIEYKPIRIYPFF